MSDIEIEGCEWVDYLSAGFLLIGTWDPEHVLDVVHAVTVNKDSNDHWRVILANHPYILIVTIDIYDTREAAMEGFKKISKGGLFITQSYLPGTL